MPYKTADMQALDLDWEHLFLRHVYTPLSLQSAPFWWMVGNVALLLEISRTSPSSRFEQLVMSWESLYPAFSTRRILLYVDMWRTRCFRGSSGKHLLIGGFSFTHVFLLQIHYSRTCISSDIVDLWLVLCNINFQLVPRPPKGLLPRTWIMDQGIWNKDLSPSNTR
jgi:hypothetical protein